MAARSTKPESNKEQRINEDDWHRTFLQAFPHYIRVDFSCKHFNEEQPHRFVSYLITALEELCADLSMNLTSTQIVYVPAPYTYSIAESESSALGQQDRGTLLAGVRLPRGDDEDDEDRRQYYLDTVTESISRWHEGILDSDVYADEQVVPTLFAILTDRRYIDESLQIDPTYTPAVGSSTPIQYPKQPVDVKDPWHLPPTEPSPIAAPTEPSASTKSNKLRPAMDILNGLRHDARWTEDEYIVVYRERFGGFKSAPVEKWARDSTEESFVPQHRISAFRNVRTGQTVWHKESRLDLLYGG